MAQRTSGLRAVFSISWVYDSFQNLVGAERSRARLVTEVFRPAAGSRVLDIGCGTAAILKHLPQVEYVGVDLSEAYVHTARQLYGERGTFLVGRAGDLCLPHDARFDLAVAIGLLHHLDDEEVEQLFHSVRPRLEDDGRLVTIDPTLVEHQHPIARWIIRNDRGLNVRRPDELARLAKQVFPSVTVTVRTDLLRIPYTHAILEAKR